MAIRSINVDAENARHGIQRQPVPIGLGDALKEKKGWCMVDG